MLNKVAYAIIFSVTGVVVAVATIMAILGRTILRPTWHTPSPGAPVEPNGVLRFKDDRGSLLEVYTGKRLAVYERAADKLAFEGIYDPSDHQVFIPTDDPAAPLRVQVDVDQRRVPGMIWEDALPAMEKPTKTVVGQRVFKAARAVVDFDRRVVVVDDAVGKLKCDFTISGMQHAGLGMYDPVLDILVFQQPDMIID